MDKYAHLRPARQRRCRKSDGVQKRIMSKDHAVLAAQNLADREHRPMNAYSCDDCGGWHVGHAGPNQRIDGSRRGETVRVEPAP